MCPTSHASDIGIRIGRMHSSQDKLMTLVYLMIVSVKVSSKRVLMGKKYI